MHKWLRVHVRSPSHLAHAFSSVTGWALVAIHTNITYVHGCCISSCTSTFSHVSTHHVQLTITVYCEYLVTDTGGMYVLIKEIHTLVFSNHKLNIVTCLPTSYTPLSVSPRTNVVVVCKFSLVCFLHFGIYNIEIRIGQ